MCQELRNHLADSSCQRLAEEAGLLLVGVAADGHRCLFDVPPAAGLLT